MTAEELKEKLNEIQKMKCETKNLELKSAKEGCPKKLYDTFSSFSNQDDGGIIIFGIDEKNDYEECGVYDLQDLQKKINEQCLQMEPVVRPLFTIAEKDKKYFLSAEIPGMDLAERPCYYRGRGRLKGSYVRVGDSDEPMTEYEIYSFEAFRKKYQDDVREIPRAVFQSLNQEALNKYIADLKKGKPNLRSLPDKEIYELMGITRNGNLTLSTVLLFGLYPQAYFPQLCITAVSVPGTEIGELGERGERFSDNQRIEGTIPEMLEGALKFAKKNMRTMTIINPQTGRREDQQDYPIIALREAVLNALVHRDYSIHTEGMPVQILIFSERMEIRSPGGLYGRIRIDQLGKIQPDTRNPVLASALEILGLTENRYSGIPVIRKAMQQSGLPEPEFLDERGSFIVRFCNDRKIASDTKETELPEDVRQLLLFCRTPRTRKEISEYLGLSSVTYAIQRHVMPLVEQGYIRMSIPDRPGSPKQLFSTVKEIHD